MLLNKKPSATKVCFSHWSPRNQLPGSSHKIDIMYPALQAANVACLLWTTDPETAWSVCLCKVSFEAPHQMNQRLQHYHRIRIKGFPKSQCVCDPRFTRPFVTLLWASGNQATLHSLDLNQMTWCQRGMLDTCKHNINPPWHQSRLANGFCLGMLFRTMGTIMWWPSNCVIDRLYMIS